VEQAAGPARGGAAGAGDHLLPRDGRDRWAAARGGVGALWAAEVEGDAFTAPFSAPSAGPPPWNLYYFTLRTAFGVASAEPHGATRWRFG
jgi:hypothetical protein